MYFFANFKETSQNQKKIKKKMLQKFEITIIYSQRRCCGQQNPVWKYPAKCLLGDNACNPRTLLSFSIKIFNKLKKLKREN